MLKACLYDDFEAQFNPQYSQIVDSLLILLAHLFMCLLLSLTIWGELQIWQCYSTLLWTELLCLERFDLNLKVTSQISQLKLEMEGVKKITIPFRDWNIFIICIYLAAGANMYDDTNLRWTLYMRKLRTNMSKLKKTKKKKNFAWISI